VAPQNEWSSARAVKAGDYECKTGSCWGWWHFSSCGCISGGGATDVDKEEGRGVCVCEGRKLGGARMRSGQQRQFLRNAC
jgi:hypothetical protein